MNVHDYIPISVLTDSYKASHFVQYPDATKMVAVRFSYMSSGPTCSHRGYDLHACLHPVCSMENLEKALMAMRRTRG